RAAKLEQDDGSVRRHEGIAARGMHGPYGHVPRSRRVADVDRIGQERAGIVAFGQLMPQPRESLLAHARLIDLRYAGCDIEPERLSLHTIMVRRLRRPDAGGLKDSAHVGRASQTQEHESSSPRHSPEGTQSGPRLAERRRY